MTWITTHFAIDLVTILVLAATILVLQQRRSPQSTAAWLLFIVAVPYLAIPLFLALGFRKQGSRFPPILYSASTAPPPANGLDALYRGFGLPAAQAGHRFALLDTPQSALAGLMDLVATAERSLDVLFYIVADDPVGEAFVDALAVRARRGVAVRLVVDRFGTLRPPRAAIRRFKAAGGQIRYFSPFLHLPDNGQLNLRNHRKMVIADQSRVFAGGMNAGAVYMAPAPDPDAWTDLSYLLEGPVVQTFLDVFHSDWDVTGKTVSTLRAADGGIPAGNACVQLVPSGPDTLDDPLHDGLVHAIHTANRRIWLVTPYFVPTEMLGNALATAARRGVDVRIVVPEKSNQRLADFARGAYLREMADAGCRILFFRKGMIHAKTGIFDAAAYVGSANFDVRSMLLNFESALFLYDGDSVMKLENWHLEQERHCVEGMRPAGLARRLAESVFRLGAPVL